MQSLTRDIHWYSMQISVLSFLSMQQYLFTYTALIYSILFNFYCILPFTTFNQLNDNVHIWCVTTNWLIALHLIICALLQPLTMIKKTLLQYNPSCKNQMNSAFSSIVK